MKFSYPTVKLCRSIRKLDFWSIYLDRNGIANIVDFLRSLPPSLEGLEFAHVPLTKNEVSTLAAAIDESFKEKYLNLEMHACGIDDGGADALSAALPRLQSLTLSNNNLHAPLRFAQALPNANQLSVIDLSSNTLSADGARAVLDGLAAAPALDIAMLQQTVPDSAAATHFASFLCQSAASAVGLANNPLSFSFLERFHELLRHNACKTTLRSLDLSRTALSDTACPTISSILFLLPQLNRLYLSLNDLSNECVHALLPALSAHATLSAMDLSFNRITAEGGRAVINLLDSEHHAPLTFLDVRNNQVPKELLHSIDGRLRVAQRERDRKKAEQEERNFPDSAPTSSSHSSSAPSETVRVQPQPVPAVASHDHGDRESSTDRESRPATLQNAAPEKDQEQDYCVAGGSCGPTAGDAATPAVQSLPAQDGNDLSNRREGKAARPEAVLRETGDPQTIGHTAASVSAVLLKELAVARLDALLSVVLQAMATLTEVLSVDDLHSAVLASAEYGSLGPEQRARYLVIISALVNAE